MDMIAVCSRCGEAKPAGEFYANRRMANGLSSYCKVCQIEKSKDSYRRRNPGAVKGKRKARARLPERACVGCSAMYAPYFEHHEYCTEACRREVQSTIKGECIDCGVQFTKHRTSKVRDRCRECHRGIAQRKRIAVLTERGVYGAARASAPLLTIACEQCGADMLTYDKVRRWCSAECKYDARSDAGRGPRPIERGERRCIDCSADISHVWSLRRCRDCDVKRMRASMRAKGGDDKKRARRHGVQYEYVSRRRLYKRDGWQCGICSELIDHTLAYPDPRSASLDHAIPISLGGPHTYANCQAAHLDCNIAKSNRVDDELEKAI